MDATDLVGDQMRPFGVKSCEWFVKYNHAWVHNEYSRKSDKSFFAPAQIVGDAIFEMSGINHFERLTRASLRLVAPAAFHVRGHRVRGQKAAGSTGSGGGYF